ncbi:MAG: hypothetical protein CMO31_03925 [Trueperaceae bacterium]|nr:hypothetical protein [Trueperaceae bacterium]|tara:strand:+ start:32666 stop:33799 length:1134 start_codon:yes stop_codon:yes gene_type:complete
MDITKHIAQRVKTIPLGRQTSVAVPGLIGLSSGTPDFEPPEFIFEAMREAIDAKKASYTAWAGSPELRQAAATKLKRENQLTFNPDNEIMVTSGAQEALVSVLMGTLDPGENALIPTPHYGNYSDVARMLGAELVTVPTTIDSNFTIDPDALEASITPKTRMLIIVTPCNPTGTVIPEETLRGIAEVAVRNNLLVLSDEIYEHYVYGEHKHVSLASFPGMRERTIVLNSLSKGYALTGLRVGYVAAREELIDAFMPFHHAMTICATSVAQAGATVALEHPRDWFEPILQEYERRRGVWTTALDQMGFPYCELQGAYYVAFDISDTGLSAAEFSNRLREEGKVLMGNAGPTIMRGSLMQKSPLIEEGLDRLASFSRSL